MTVGLRHSGGAGGPLRATRTGAGGGNRTRTPLAGPGILSPVRLPISPPRHTQTDMRTTRHSPMSLAAGARDRVPSTAARLVNAQARSVVIHQASVDIIHG